MKMRVHALIFAFLFALIFFGVNSEASAQEAHSFIYPFESTSAYTNVWVLGDSYPGHQGVDYACPEGTPVYASFTGTVTQAYDGEEVKSCVAYGNNIVIQQDGCTIRYAHLLFDSIPFEVGDTVHAGDLVGLTSNTGLTGPDGPNCVPGSANGYHLHYEVRCNGSSGLDPYTQNGGLFMTDADGSYHFPKESFFSHSNPPQRSVELILRMTLRGTTLAKKRGFLRMVALVLGSCCGCTT